MSGRKKRYAVTSWLIDADYSENYWQLQFATAPTPKRVPLLVTMLPILLVVLVLFLLTGTRLQCVVTHQSDCLLAVRGEDGARQLVSGKETKLH